MYNNNLIKRHAVYNKNSHVGGKVTGDYIWPYYVIALSIIIIYYKVPTTTTTNCI